MSKEPEKKITPTNLIEELSENRRGQYVILEKVVGIRNKIEEFVPDIKEFRNRYLAQEKMKAVADIIKAELEIRKSIDTSVIKEIDLRNKYEQDFGEETVKGKRLEDMTIEEVLNKINIGDLTKES